MSAFVSIYLTQLLHDVMDGVWCAMNATRMTRPVILLRL